MSLESQMRHTLRHQGVRPTDVKTYRALCANQTGVKTPLQRRVIPAPPCAVLLRPEKQLAAAGHCDVKGFGELVIGQIGARLDQAPRIEDSLFDKSFVSDSRRFHVYAVAQAELQGWTRTVVLPPLLLRANENVVVDLPGVLVICHREGPIIPVIQAGTETPTAISTLYALSSAKYVNRGNVKRFFADLA